MKKIRAILSIMLLIAMFATFVALWGCKKTNTVGGMEIASVSEEKSDELAGGADRTVVDASSQFGFNIFKKLMEEDRGENIFISPLSITLALTMTYNGAVGDTAAGMAEALQFAGMDLEELNQALKDIMVSILNADPDIVLSIANSIWVKEGFSPKEDFMERNKKYFGSEVRKLDFSSPDAADTINGWISDSTRGLIEKMLDVIPADAVMYLINAIYFKGDWTYPFSEDATFDDDFYLEDGSAKKVPMMHMGEEFGYAEGPDFSAVKLPYGQEKLAMYIILPDEGVDVDEVISGFDSELWNDFKNSFTKRQVVLSMPKYKMEYGIKLLNDVLIDLGMGIAFEPRADFSGIAPEIFISRVLHKAVIEVNEKGSEAAAATVVEMVESAMPMEEQVEFYVNRPFFFLIADDRSGSIMFMGKVMEP